MSKNNHVHLKKPIFNYVVLAVFIMIFISWLFILPRLSGSLRIYDQKALYEIMKQSVADLDLSGKLVYEKVHDDGCDNRSSTGLQSHTYCGITATKIYKNNNNLSEDLHRLDAEIKKNGFGRSLYLEQTDQDFEGALKGGEYGGSLKYKKSQMAGIELAINFYRAPTQMNNDSIERYIKSSGIDAPQNGEYLYGVTLGSPYYICSPILFEPCLFMTEPIR